MTVLSINRKLKARSQSGVIAGVIDSLLATFLAIGLILLIVNSGIAIYYKLKFSQAAKVGLTYARDRALKTTRFSTDTATVSDIRAVVEFALTTMGIRATNTNVSIDTNVRVRNNPAVVITVSMPVRFIGPFGQQNISEREVAICPRTVNYLGFQCSPGGLGPSPGHNGGYKMLWVPIVAAPPSGTPNPAMTRWLCWPRKAEIDDCDHHQCPYVGDPPQLMHIADRIHGYCYAAPNGDVVLPGDSTAPPP